MTPPIHVGLAQHSIKQAGGAVSHTISTGSILRSEAQLWLKRPRTEMTDHTDPIAPPSLAPSTSAPSSAIGVTLEAILAQLQCMDARFDSLTDEMCQMNTLVGRIAWQQARLGGFAPSPSPSLKASVDKDGDDGDDEDDNASSSNDDKMMTSQWLTLCHSWQKGEVILGLKVALYLGEELV